MSGQWRVLDFLGFRGQVRSVRGGLEVFDESGHSRRVACADLAVVLFGPGVDFSSGVMNRLMDNATVLFYCDWRGIPRGASYPWSNHSRVGARQIAQCEVSLPKKKNAWAKIVRAKIMGQATTLRLKGASGAGELVALSRQVRSGDPENLEARAARIYWKPFLPSGVRREYGVGSDNINSCLDYGYTILRGHGIRSVLGAGLNPAFGLFHRGRGNLFHLVDDLIEPFRPAIDAAVWDIGLSARLADPSVRKQLVAATTQKFLDDGTCIPTAFDMLAQSYGRYVEGDGARFDVPYWHEFD